MYIPNRKKKQQREENKINKRRKIDGPHKKIKVEIKKERTRRLLKKEEEGGDDRKKHKDRKSCGGGDRHRDRHKDDALATNECVFISPQVEEPDVDGQISKDSHLEKFKEEERKCQRSPSNKTNKNYIRCKKTKGQLTDGQTKRQGYRQQ